MVRQKSSIKKLIVSLIKVSKLISLLSRYYTTSFSNTKQPNVSSKLPQRLLRGSITKINNIFRLSNTDMSYLIKIMPNRQLEQLYFGPTLALKEDDFSLLEHSEGKAAGTVKYAKNSSFTLADKHQECALYGTTAFQEASLEVTVHDTPH